MSDKQYSILLTGAMPRSLTGERRRAYGRQRIISVGLGIIWVVTTVLVLGTAPLNASRTTRWNAMIALAIVLAAGKILYQLIKGETSWQLARKERQQHAQSSDANKQQLADFAVQTQQKDHNGQT